MNYDILLIVIAIILLIAIGVLFYIRTHDTSHITRRVKKSKPVSFVLETFGLSEKEYPSDTKPTQEEYDKRKAWLLAKEVPQKNVDEILGTSILSANNRGDSADNMAHYCCNLPKGRD